VRLLFTLVGSAALLAIGVGTALALTGDVWDGSGHISTAGHLVFTGDSYKIDTPPVFVYEKTITFTLTNESRHSATYTVTATGRLFGNQLFTGALGQQVTQGLGFRGAASLKDQTGHVVCTGTLIAGGRWDGDAFGELTFSSTCPVFSGPQYLSFKTRGDGTSVANVSMQQR
jgi:hypothetical protein